METVSEVMTALQKKGNAQTRKIYARHGAPESMFGVKVGDLKPIAKRIKGQHELAIELYDTANSDAMYLAGMVADGTRMTKKQLDSWAKAASWYFISEYAVPGVAVESPHAADLARKWIRARKESVQACGWCTYSGILATHDDAEIDITEVRELLATVVEKIHTAPNRVRYTMNGFVISVGTYVQPLLNEAKVAAKKIGKVEVEMGETACKVPLATAYIGKVEAAGRIGRKRKTIKC